MPISRSAALVPVLAFASAVAAQVGGGMYDLTKFRTIKITIASANWWNTLVANKTAEIYSKAVVDIDGTTFKDVGVRARGASAYNAAKRRTLGKLPLKISFDKFVANRTFLGRKAMDLNNGFWTPTFMREILILHVMQDYIQAPRANFVKVIINGANFGVYVNVERPNKDFVRDRYEDNDGNRYHGRTQLSYRGTDPNFYKTVYPLMSNPRPDSYYDLITALRATTYTGNQAFVEIPKFWNVDLSLKVEALNMAFNNYDAYPRHNYYMYSDPYHRQIDPIPWDTNLSLRGSSLRSAPRWLFHSNLWIRQYQAHLRDVAENSMDWTVIAKKIATWQALIDTAVKADSKKFYTYTDFKNGVLRTAAGIKGLKPAIDGLRTSIRSIYNRPRVALTAHVRTPAQPAPNETVWIAVKAQSSATVAGVQLHWRSRGRFQVLAMFDDGNHRDGKAGDGVFGLAIPFKSAGAQVDYYLSAETTAKDISFLPIYTGNKPFSFRYLKPTLDSALIHEFVANNTSGLRDGKGDYEDWIELYNPTTKRIDLGGMYLSDDRNNGKKWQIPANILIDPGFSLIIWADNEPAEGPLHANFKLSDRGEEIYLSSKAGMLLDYVEFGRQLPNVSLGRLEDKPAQVFVSYPVPTPLMGNGLYQCGVRRYSAAVPETHSMQLEVIGLPKINTTTTVKFTGAPANVGYVLMLGAQATAAYIENLGFTMLIGSPLLSIHLPTTSSNPLSVPMKIPNDPSLDGFRLTMQALSADKGRILSSNAVQVQFCK